ncbi:MAG: DUF6152 family protein [Gammaproteobacteria bacterium]|nr:DUF6152 family protein [Gammaproteobacteria bacterium]
MQLKSLSLAAMATYAVAFPAWAHHSHGNYQLTEYTLLEGTVKEFHMVNPHTWIYLEVTDAGGQPNLWALETTGIRGLTRIGVTRDTVKVGDTISVRCHRLRDGSNGCLLGFLTPEGGVEKEWD